MSNLGSFAGIIDKNGYRPPAGVTVTWWHPSAPSRVQKRLRPEIGTDSHFDLVHRYGESDQNLNGWQTTPAVSSEHGGGEAYALVAELFQRHGVGRPPTEQEWVDFAFANFAGLQTVSVDDARRILADYRQGGEGGAQGSTGNPQEVVDLKAKVAELQAQVGLKDQQIAELKKRRAIPPEIEQTLRQLPSWREIPAPGGPQGKLARIKRLIAWVREQAAGASS